MSILYVLGDHMAPDSPGQFSSTLIPIRSDTFLLSLRDALGCDLKKKKNCTKLEPMDMWSTYLCVFVCVLGHVLYTPTLCGPLHRKRYRQ